VHELLHKHHHHHAKDPPPPLHNNSTCQLGSVVCCVLAVGDLLANLLLEDVRLLPELAHQHARAVREPEGRDGLRETRAAEPVLLARRLVLLRIHHITRKEGRKEGMNEGRKEGSGDRGIEN
jgi:hypothetical protein